MQVIFYIYENANIEKAHEISPPCAHYFTFSLNFEATNQYHTTVSYTHLDVYKRQVNYILQPQRRTTQKRLQIIFFS